MKKIFLFFAALCAIVACDPTHEDIGNAGHITAEQLRSMTTVTVDDAGGGKTGNVVSCQTLAPVNAKWTIAGKEFVGNFAKKKMKVGKHMIYLTALCADGTLLKDSAEIECQVITDPLQKYYIYGEDPEAQPPFVPENWVSNNMRFSDNEGAHFPFLTDEIYWGFKTLIIDVSNASDDLEIRAMSGWWDNFNADGSETSIKWVSGLNEFQLTEDIAKICAKGNDGKNHDLTFMVRSGTCTVNSVYYEE
jgi:hypothetical protein